MVNHAYAARCCYAGKKDFYLGTIVAEARLPEHELLPKFHKLWADISPHAFPDFCKIIPGICFFVPEKELPGT